MECAYVELTRKCNLKCSFCSLGGRGDEHSEDFLKKIIKNYAKKGFKKLMLTGGEPLLIENLEEFIRYGLEVGFEQISLQTNGTHLTKQKARMLKKSKIDNINISIHSHIPECEDSIMKGTSVLSKQLKGISNAHSEGIFCLVTIVINKENYEHLPQFLDFMLSKYPYVIHYTLNFVEAVGRAKDNKEIVPRYVDVELFLAKALFKLKKAKKSFRVERVPLCYMTEFAEYSTELRRIITKEQNIGFRGASRSSFNENYFNKMYRKGEPCSVCFLDKICPGVNKNYVTLYGLSELYPIFINPKKIILKSGAD